MDPRTSAFLVHEAQALQRQEMARIARAVNAGMTGGKGMKEFMTGLELDRSRNDIIRDNWLALGVDLPGA